MCQEKSIDIFVDNKSTIILEKKTHFFKREMSMQTADIPPLESAQEKKRCDWVMWIKFINQVAYILTKVLKWEDFCKLKALLGHI